MDAAVNHSPTTITKDRLKTWSACADGYRWFLEKFPDGGEFVTVHKALIKDKRGDDADWLIGKALDGLDTAERVKQITIISGSDAVAIAEAVAEGANAATTGNWSNAATTGEGANAATTGEGAIAAALGGKARAKAGVGGAVVLAHRAEDGRLMGVVAAMVGGDVEPDTWYVLDESGVLTKDADQ